MNTTHFTCYMQDVFKFSALYTIWLSLVHLQVDSAVTGTRDGVSSGNPHKRLTLIATTHLVCTPAILGGNMRQGIGV